MNVIKHNFFGKVYYIKYMAEEGEKDTLKKVEVIRTVDVLRTQGYSLDEACELMGISSSEYYNWRKEVFKHLKPIERDALRDYGYFL
ncbi:hypothetical protein DRO97_06005 [Archaeoglobales archaeon]|nr:MAG: hypothetical protein DRO97_06005 [Archaeoglobales archaeon]